MEKAIRIAGIGELLWDMLPTGKQLGGAPCNFAFHASQAGAETYVISSIGDDENGRELSSVMDSLGLSRKFIQVTDVHPTGVVNVELNANGVPSYEIKEDVAWDNIRFDNSLVNLASQLDAVCFGSLAQRNTVSRESVLKFVGATSDDCLRVFDINLRQHYFSRHVVEASLALANVLKLNDEELPVIAEMFGYPEGEAIRLLMHDFRLKLIAYTQGSKGSTLFTEDETSIMEIEKVNVADTVGAGDSFTAMLVVGMLRGADLRQIHKTASRVSSFVCTQKGATPVLPREILSF